MELKAPFQMVARCGEKGIWMERGWGYGLGLDRIWVSSIPRDSQKSISQGKVQDFFAGMDRGIANFANPAVFVTPNHVKKRYLCS